METKFSFGLIGAGMIGDVLTRCVQEDPRSRITWVCSRTEASAQALAVRHAIPHVTTRVEDLLAGPQVDAVIIATPPYLHVDLLEMALAAGKHVLVEKPLAVSPQEARRAAKLPDRYPDAVVLDASCRHTRLQPKFNFVKSLIESGRLGTVYHIHHNHLIPETFVEYNPKAADWGADKRLAGGGPFMDWGVYDLSFHLGLLGDRPQLRSLQSFTRSGLRDQSHLVTQASVEQHGAAWLEFDTGLTYYYERGAGVHGQTACQTRVYGTQAGLRLTYPTWDSPTIELFDSPGTPRCQTLTVDMSAHPADDNIPLISHFIDCLAGKAQPLMPIPLAVKHLEILFQIMGDPA